MNRILRFTILGLSLMGLMLVPLVGASSVEAQSMADRMKRRAQQAPTGLPICPTPTSRAGTRSSSTWLPTPTGPPTSAIS